MDIFMASPGGCPFIPFFMASRGGPRGIYGTIMSLHGPHGSAMATRHIYMGFLTNFCRLS